MSHYANSIYFAATFIQREIKALIDEEITKAGNIKANNKLLRRKTTTLCSVRDDGSDCVEIEISRGDRKGQGRRFPLKGWETKTFPKTDREAQPCSSSGTTREISVD